MKKRHNIFIPPRFGSMEVLPMCIERTSNEPFAVMELTGKEEQCGYSFTVEGEEGKFNHIVFWVYVQLRYSENSSESWQTIALLDTGATRSAVTDTLARKMKLTSNRTANLGTAEGRADFPLHTIDVILPYEKVIENLEVAEIKDDGRGFGFVMGMDLIKRGGLSIANSGGKMTVSFTMR